MASDFTVSGFKAGLLRDFHLHYLQCGRRDFASALKNTI
jgi:hypothetical protein